jgi:transaldolase
MRAANALQRLHDYGQSVWLDYIGRRLLDEGELRRLVHAAEVWGVTANPTIFERAIAGSSEYDDRLRALVVAGQSGSEVYESLVGQDIQQAADILRPVYEQTEGADGYVSIEVSPALAHDTARTIQEAKKFHQAIARPNILIKVPATAEGLPAITSLIADGISVNVTLIFGLTRYGQVLDAYLSGLEERTYRGEPLGTVISVASFFISRVDTLVDTLLEQRQQDMVRQSEQNELAALRGKAAIANARLAYQRFLETQAGERFRRLQAQGGRLQRPLWASTGTKNPAYRDVLYVEELIGHGTVNTMPPQTLQAFRDHGQVRETITQDLPGQRAVVERLAAVGIDLDEVGQELENEGVRLFADSFDKLAASIAQRAQVIDAPRAKQAAAAVSTSDNR